MIKSGFDWLINPLSVMSLKQKRHGLSFTIRLPRIGEVIVTGDPRHIKDLISQKEFNAGEGIRVLGNILGQHSVICLDGDKHQQRHLLLSKYFYSDKIALYDDELRFACAERLALIKKLSIFNFYTFSRDILIEVALLQLLGTVDPDLCGQLRFYIQAASELNIHPMVLFVKPLQLKCLGLSSWGRLVYYQQQIRITLKKIIFDDSIGDESLLFYLKQHMESYYDNDDELIDELMALIFFSHETTAATIAAIADFLVGNDDMISRMLEDKKYLQACIKEGMRLRPVVPHITRTSRISQCIGHYNLQKDQWLFPSSYLAHFNEEVFPEHAVFSPGRFLPDKDYPYSSFPFGIGERICLGKKLANRHMEIMLTEIFSTLKLRPNKIVTPSSKRRFVLMVPSNLDNACVVENKLNTID